MVSGRIRAAGEGSYPSQRELLNWLDEYRELARTTIGPNEETGPKVLLNVRVLVVDEDREILALLVSTLRMAGAVVTSAPSVASALKILRGVVVDLIISDISSRGDDGYARAFQLSDAGKRGLRRPPALALTSWISDDFDVRARATGFAASLRKPFSPAELIAIAVGLTRAEAWWWD